jgi:hypothetical protein
MMLSDRCDQCQVVAEDQIDDRHLHLVVAEALACGSAWGIADLKREGIDPSCQSLSTWRSLWWLGVADRLVWRGEQVIIPVSVVTVEVSHHYQGEVGMGVGGGFN